LADSIAPFVDGYDAILLANHGMVSYGQDLMTAFFRMETTEHFARVALVTEMRGKQVLLSSGDVQKLVAARARYGLQTAPNAGPEFPVTSETAANTERITLTRRELEALVEEAVKNDRARQ
jgi:L-fuculose-phosphate aldolase